MGSRIIRMALTVCVIASSAAIGWAGRGRALGSVIESNNALVDNQTALAGADVYPCDVLDTDSYGGMRVQFGGSQIVLSPSSEVVLDGEPNAVRVIVVSGITSFSSSAPGALEVDTPAGVLRESAGAPFAGSVNVNGMKSLIVSSVRGDLLLNSGGLLHTVPAGKSARITFDRAASASCHEPPGVRSAYGPHHVNFKLLGAAAIAGGAGATVWLISNESPTKPQPRP